MTVKTAPAHRPVQSPLVMALPLTGALIGEAGSETEHAPLSARAGQLAGVQGGDRGFPVDAGQLGAGVADAVPRVDEAGEVVAGQP